MTEEQNLSDLSKILSESLNQSSEPESSETSESVAPVETEAHESPPEAVGGIAAPEDWPEEDRALFERLDDEGRTQLLDIDKRYKSGLTQKASEVAAINEALQPYEERFRLTGVSPDQAITQLLAAQSYLERDPVEGIKWLMKSYNVSPESFGEEPEFEDNSEVAELRKQVAQLTQAVQGYINNDAGTKVSNFQNAKDNDGNLLHPHFGKVESLMAALIQADPKLPMEDAYSRACMAHPEISQQVLKEREESAVAEFQRRQEAERDKKVAKARNAAAHLDSKGTTTEQPEGESSLADIIRQAAAQHGV